jgi:hypothetical protein
MSDVQGNVTAPTVMHQPTLLGGAENMKLLFDEELDSRRETLARQRAWEDLSLRRAQNAATIDHAINAGLILQGQVGATESAQTVSPVSRGEGDSATAQSYPANRTIDVAAAGVATANQALADQLAALVAAVTAAIVAASGKAAGTTTPTT